MDNVKGTLLILTLVLLATTFVLFLKNAAAQDRLDDAFQLGVASRDLLKAQSVGCQSAPEEYAGLAECIKPLLLTDDFKQDSFKQPNVKQETTGFLVIKNTNKKVFQSESFTFYKNRELAQTGCTVPGEIGLDVTCRFDYPGDCDEGDVLEVYYEEDLRIFLKTC